MQYDFTITEKQPSGCFFDALKKGGGTVKLTIKQDRFIDYYLELGNATKAAIKAGYSAKSANCIGPENLTKLSAEIKARAAQKDSERIASADEVLRYLTSVVRGEAQAEIVVVEGTGNGESEARTIQKRPDERERLKAAELLGKRYGVFSEKVEMNVTNLSWYKEDEKT